MSASVRITVKRFDPLMDRGPHDESYEVPVSEKMTILDGLIYVYENLEPGLAFDFGCRYACCGACSVKVDGRPTLICQEPLQKDIEVEPLENLPVLKDLVVDKSDFYATLDRYQPFLQPQRFEERMKPDVLDPRDFQDFKVASRCIACLNCNSECGVIKGEEEFEGPAFFVQLARFLFDPRDRADRREIIRMAYLCTECGQCDEVCPKGIPISHTLGRIKTLTPTASAR
jgi:succinate dehydrogenase/fumarate reductase iron-sulfur protein